MRLCGAVCLLLLLCVVPTRAQTTRLSEAVAVPASLVEDHSLVFSAATLLRRCTYEGTKSFEVAKRGAACAVLAGKPWHAEDTSDDADAREDLSGKRLVLLMRACSLGDGFGCRWGARSVRSLCDKLDATRSCTLHLKSPEYWVDQYTFFDTPGCAGDDECAAQKATQDELTAQEATARQNLAAAKQSAPHHGFWASLAEGLSAAAYQLELQQAYQAQQQMQYNAWLAQSRAPAVASYPVSMPVSSGSGSSGEESPAVASSGAESAASGSAEQGAGASASTSEASPVAEASSGAGSPAQGGTLATSAASGTAAGSAYAVHDESRPSNAAANASGSPYAVQNESQPAESAAASGPYAVNSGSAQNTSPSAPSGPSPKADPHSCLERVRRAAEYLSQHPEHHGAVPAC